jgi:nitrite reductase/ring-hydroxylating ferredoxin subunit
MTRVHVIPRADVPPDGVVRFDAGGVTGLVADVDGDLQAWAVVGPSSAHAGEAAVADGRVLCPLHGWPIDARDGSCGAGRLCRYDRLRVDADEIAIRVHLPAR